MIGLAGTEGVPKGVKHRISWCSVWFEKSCPGARRHDLQCGRCGGLAQGIKEGGAGVGLVNWLIG